MASRNRKSSTTSVRGTTLVRIFLILVVSINIYSIVFVLNTSLKTKNDFYGNIWGIPNTFFGENYVTAWVQGNIGQYFINSIIVTSLSLAITLILATLAGYALSRLKLPFANAITTLFLSMLVIPNESIILNLYRQFVTAGIANTLFVPMIIVYIGWSMPMSVVILKNFFDTIPNDLLDAARIDGASEMATLRNVVLPLMTPALGTVTIFDFCGIWGELLWAQVSTSAQSNQGLTLPVGLLSFQGQYGTDWGPMSAAIIVIIVPLIIMFLFLQKYFITGLTAGSIKG